MRVGAAGLLRPVLGVCDQTIGVLGASFFMKSLRRTFRTRSTKYRACKRRRAQVPLEAHAVEAEEHSDDEAGKLDDEARQRLHGVLLREGLANPYSGARTPSLLILFGCGSAALGTGRKQLPDSRAGEAVVGTHSLPRRGLGPLPGAAAPGIGIDLSAMDPSTGDPDIFSGLPCKIGSRSMVKPGSHFCLVS